MTSVAKIKSERLNKKIKARQTVARTTFTSRRDLKGEKVKDRNLIDYAEKHLK